MSNLLSRIIIRKSPRNPVNPEEPKEVPRTPDEAETIPVSAESQGDQAAEPPKQNGPIYQPYYYPYGYYPYPYAYYYSAYRRPQLIRSGKNQATKTIVKMAFVGR